MDSAFLLDPNARADFLRLLMQSLGCTYISFWSYFPNPANCLRFLDGLYIEEFNGQLPSSSSGITLALRLFNEYKQLSIGVSEDDRVPGFAFRNSFPYLELQEMDLQRLASNERQRQFYQEARIKIAVFMGCKNGEIELGFSNVPQMDMKMEIRSCFPENFPGQTSQLAAEDHVINFPNQSSRLADLINSRPILPADQINQNPPSSSSSSLRSLSIDSPEYSSLLFNINPTTNPTTTNTTTNTNTNTNTNITTTTHHTELIINPPLQSLSTSPSILPHRQANQAFARLRNVPFPSPEMEDAAMTKAILAVLTSPSPGPSSSSSSSHHQMNPHHHMMMNPNSSAFKTYSATPIVLSALDHHRRRQQQQQQMGPNRTIFKRSVSFFRSLNYVRNRQRLQAAATTTCRPTTSNQLHHMISERKRREKLNESFQSLRSLLPPGTKKDKASVLNTTTDYLNSLKAQVEELSQRNKLLESQVFPAEAIKGANDDDQEVISDSNPSSSTSVHQRVDVRIRHVSESTSEEAEIIYLQVILRTANNIVPAEDLVLRVLEFLKRVENVSLMSMEANTQLTGSSTSINRLTMRLRVEGNEWDESAFQEAVRRVVAELAQ